MSWTRTEKNNYDEQYEFSENDGHAYKSKIKNHVIKSVEFAHSAYSAVITCKIIKRPEAPYIDENAVHLELSVSSQHFEDISELADFAVFNKKTNQQRGTVKKIIDSEEKSFYIWKEEQYCCLNYENNPTTYVGIGGRTLYRNIVEIFSEKCGLLKISYDPTECAFEKIENSLRNHDAILLAHDQLFYVDINNRTIDKILITDTNKSFIEKLKAEFTYRYQTASESELELITSIIGRTYYQFEDSDVDIEICHLYHQLKNEQRLSNKILLYVKSNEIDTAIKTASQLQTDGYYFYPMWKLASYLHNEALYHNSRITLQCVYMAYEAVSPNSPHFQAARKKMLEIIMPEPCAPGDDYFEEKFKCMVQSKENQRIIDLFFHQLCGQSGLTPTITNVQADVDTLCSLARELRILYKERDQLRIERNQILANQ